MSKLITILGPTASGKTKLAAHLAAQIDGEIISADSRQVYRGLDIGSGKDLKDYVVHGREIPYHLIDIIDLDQEYNIFEFQKDFYKAYDSIISRGKQPILCGGTGLYIQTVLDGYKLYPVPKDEEFRAELEAKPQTELVALLKSYTGELHNTTDTEIKSRTIRAIEIARYCQVNQLEQEPVPKIESKVFGLAVDRSYLKDRITQRLGERMDHGMIDEVEKLLAEGVSADRLNLLGLEYKFVTQYLSGEMDYIDMMERLNIAIHQFSKRQMTWFRRMEKQGHNIEWIDGDLTLPEKLDVMIKSLRRS